MTVSKNDYPLIPAQAGITAFAGTSGDTVQR